MNRPDMNFASDNAAGVAPEILAAVADAASGPAMPYGNDPWTEAVERTVREVFEAPEARVFLVSTGTAANALALACLCPPWGTVYAHDHAHIEKDECGAPEFFTAGAKLTLVPGEGGQLTPEGLVAALGPAGVKPVHSVQDAAISISQATEWGTVYDGQRLSELTRIARDRGLGVHMDGTRFGNAVARLGCRPADLSWRAGVDILCLGATKNGAMAAEAVILFDPARAREFELRRKRGGHLLSKMRFIAAQMQAYLSDHLWLRMAARANTLADRLASGISAAPGSRVLNRVDANMVFAEVQAPAARRLRAAGAAFYTLGRAPIEGDGPVAVRLVCSAETTEAGIDSFVGALSDA